MQFTSIAPVLKYELSPITERDGLSKKMFLRTFSLCENLLPPSLFSGW